jgi:MoaA/NifB/PqqE/SkfB family radical SAM enzyme
MRLGFILTARCNAACTHCSKSFGPTRTEELSQADVFRLMNEAAAIEDQEPLCFDITGGEPFLNFEMLVAVVAHGATLGAHAISCVTNAFWARTDEITTDKLTRLKKAGLTLLGVSVSRFHQQFVPLHRAQRTLKIAGDLGISTELKAAVTRSDLEPDGLVSQWKGQLQAEWINMFPVLPHLRREAHLAEAEYYREPGLPSDKCPGEVVAVDYNGVARSCCSIGEEDSFLVVGNAKRQPLRAIYGTFLSAGKQRILRDCGPIAFAQRAIEVGLGHRLRQGYAGPCDLCIHIRTDSQLRRVAEEMAAKVQDTQSSTKPATACNFTTIA